MINIVGDGTAADKGGYRLAVNRRRCTGAEDGEGGGGAGAGGTFEGAEGRETGGGKPVRGGPGEGPGGVPRLRGVWGAGLGQDVLRGSTMMKVHWVNIFFKAGPKLLRVVDGCDWDVGGASFE